MPGAHDPGRLADWLRAKLGPRCLSVTVEDLGVRRATVRVAASLDGGAAAATSLAR